jgi:hypothetical protein
MSRQNKKPGSQAVRMTLGLRRRNELHQKLAQGYRSMAEEDRQTAERNLAAFREQRK